MRKTDSDNSNVTRPVYGPQVLPNDFDLRTILNKNVSEYYKTPMEKETIGLYKLFSGNMQPFTVWLGAQKIIVRENSKTTF